MQAKHHLACLNHLLPESGLLRQVIHARLQSNSYHQFLFEALEIVGYIIGRVFFAFPRKALNTHSLFLLRDAIVSKKCSFFEHCSKGL